MHVATYDCFVVVGGRLSLHLRSAVLGLLSALCSRGRAGEHPVSGRVVAPVAVPRDGRGFFSLVPNIPRPVPGPETVTTCSRIPNLGVVERGAT